MGSTGLAIPMSKNSLRSKIMKFKSLLFITGIVFWCSTTNAATVSVYNNATDYSAATGSQIFLIDFNGSTNMLVDGSTISAQASFTSPEAGSQNLVNWSSDALSDAGSTLVSTNVGPLSIDFTDPSILAFSLDFLSAGEQETLELYDSNNILLASVLAPNASGFFGLVSDTAIDSIIIRNGTFASGNRDRFFIDNLSANVVPIPGAIWLFGSGLLVLAGFRKKARKV